MKFTIINVVNGGKKFQIFGGIKIPTLLSRYLLKTPVSETPLIIPLRLNRTAPYHTVTDDTAIEHSHRGRTVDAFVLSQGPGYGKFSPISTRRSFLASIMNAISAVTNSMPFTITVPQIYYISRSCTSEPQNRNCCKA